MTTDVSGKVVNIGDTVAFGADNGSKLFLGRVFKLTPKKVWRILSENKECPIVYCRDYERVSIIKEN